MGRGPQGADGCRQDSGGSRDPEGAYRGGETIMCQAARDHSIAADAKRDLATHLIRCVGFFHKTAYTGAVPLIQRFGSALNLNIHFHMCGSLPASKT
jgi:hypothetical protein